MIVEIEEAAIFNERYCRSRVQTPEWAFSAAEWSSKSITLESFYQLNSQSLQEFIQHRIAPGNF